MTGPMIQPVPDLFALARGAEAKARKTDPLTSHVAAVVMNRRKAADHCAKVYAALMDHPDTTYRELAEHVEGIVASDVMKRLNDLRGKGLAVDGPKRLCRVGKNLCMTWRAA